MVLPVVVKVPLFVNGVPEPEIESVRDEIFIAPLMTTMLIWWSLPSVSVEEDWMVVVFDEKLPVPVRVCVVPSSSKPATVTVPSLVNLEPLNVKVPAPLNVPVTVTSLFAINVPPTLRVPATEILLLAVNEPPPATINVAPERIEIVPPNVLTVFTDVVPL